MWGKSSEMLPTEPLTDPKHLMTKSHSSLLSGRRTIMAQARLACLPDAHDVEGAVRPVLLVGDLNLFQREIQKEMADG